MAVTGRANHREVADLLQQLGLTEYEARCFVALSRLPDATAKEISDVSEVPRTRVYDAARGLESKGLIETQHASPKEFRTIPTDDAVELLRTAYRSRTESLRAALESVDSVERNDETDSSRAVWKLSTTRAITNRMQRLVDNADGNLVLVAEDADVMTDSLGDTLRAAHRRGVSVVVGATTDDLRESLEGRYPEIEVVSLRDTWLGRSTVVDETEIGRALLVDRDVILISTIRAVENGKRREEAVFCHGSDTGVVRLVHRAIRITLPTARSQAALPVDIP